MTRASGLRRLPWVVAALAVVLLGFAAVAGLTTDPSIRAPRITLSDSGWWVGYLTFTVVGALVAARRPGNVVGWLMLGAGTVNAVGQAAQQYAVWGLIRHPGSVPGASVAAWVTTFFWGPAVALLAGVVACFPTGSLLSRRWRWLPATLVLVTSAISVSAAVDLWPLRGARLLFPETVVSEHRFSVRVMGILWPVVIGCVIAALVSTVVRYRRARGVERQQLKWLMVAAIVSAPAIIGGELTREGSALNVALQIANSPAWFAIAVALAILRYRLYDIDRIISRTVSYAVLTATLVGLYVGVVAFATDLLPLSSSFGVAASTLLVAALFQPLRRRLQAAVDRRFNRAGYDAARTVEAFSAKLRSAVDLEVVTGDLLGVVGRTVQPATVSLWVAS